ncbi:MAG: CRISPR-associated helicase Cas3' [Saprospiraceae bacterium]
MPEILAKSDPEYSLRAHIADGLRIAEALKKAFPRVPEIAGMTDFWQWLETAVVFHDLGKAHAAFQKMLRKDSGQDWRGQRHELFSLPFVAALDVPDAEKLLLLRVVAGHHRTFTELSQHIYHEYEDPEIFEHEFSKVDVAGVLAVLRSFGDFPMRQVSAFSPQKVIKPYNREQLDKVVQQRKQLLFITGAFKHCDHLSSAFVEHIEILERRHFYFLEKKRLELQARGLDFYQHQLDAAMAVGSVILTAPTGAGKTETALLWLQKQLETEGCGQGRVFYTLPFTASINAMFERLNKSEATGEGMGEASVGMLHGNLNAYLYEKFFAEGGNPFALREKMNAVKRAFRTLQTPIKVTTPFQLLKHLFTLSGFEKGIFEWTGGYFIFDEIHAYNPSTLAQIVALLRFSTREMGAKALIMTATLPTFLKKLLHDSAPFGEIKATPELYEQFKRHRIRVATGQINEPENLKIISERLTAGKKILVVCNTVTRAQEIFQTLRADFFGEAILLHSGFNSEDRMARERQLQCKQPPLLVGTQAIEVSLDIDYDILFSELAPLDALLQRFGRVNRKREKPPCDCVIFSERNGKDKYIYPTQEVLENTLVALRDMENTNEGVVSEADLQGKIDFVYPELTPTAREDYERTLQFLEKAIDEIVPMEHSDQREEEFYEQFDGMKVLPSVCRLEYCQRLDNYDFIGAELLKVSIRKCNFARWSKVGILERDSHAFIHPNKAKAKPIVMNFFLLNLPYRKDLGLLKDSNPVSISFLEEQL